MVVVALLMLVGSLPFSGALAALARAFTRRRAPAETAVARTGGFSRRELLVTATAAVPAVALGAGATGVFSALGDPLVRTIRVPVPGLPAPLHGLRILHLTDLHLDNIDGTAEAVAERIAGLDSDLCVITGDIRDNIHAPMGPLMTRLGHVVSAVRARDGTLGVLGNHDSAAMVPPMEDLGIRVLLNETVTYARSDDLLHVTGVDDVHRFRTDDAHAALEAAPDGFCIALVHSPEAVQAAAARHRLYLTGHTHGGQICLPGGRPLALGMKVNRDLARGVWRHGDMVGYTSRGLGACVLPFRAFCPGEVVSLTLRTGPAEVAGGGR